MVSFTLEVELIVIFKNVSRDGFTKFGKGWLGHLPAITNFLLY